MPRPGFRSRTYRRKRLRTPGGKNVMHYIKKKPGKPHCAKCGIVLAGTARGSEKQVKKLSKTQRRPERPYGGVLCSKCMREEIKKKARD